MPAIVIYGLKIPFRHLWKKVGDKAVPTCNCNGSSDNFAFCPFCGAKKMNKTVKVYRSSITGKKTNYRSIDSIIDHLHRSGVGVYDTSPRGYTDDPVYLYLHNPNCYLEIDSEDPVSMSIGEYPLEIQSLLYDKLSSVWDDGEFGLWAFETPKEEKPPVTTFESKLFDLEKYLLN